MPQAESESPEDSFFNDLSQPCPDTCNPNSQESQTDCQNKPKRIACILCRKRKLRCDGARPTCATCKRLSHDCAYDEVRKKSGPKRGYVKLLEQRLLQVETLLKNQDTSDTTKETSRPDPAAVYITATAQQPLPHSTDFLTHPNNSQGRRQEEQTPGADSLHNGGGIGHNGEHDFPWEMIGLGLEEPLPPQDVMDDLYNIYFSKIHGSIPIIHRPRFLAALNLAPHMRPPICLRYIMWTLAASVTDKYEALQEHFYQRARKYAQIDEMKGHGESTITLAHCQAWILTCTYEFKQMYFPRAWLSAGRAVRLAQMMQLHRLDGAGLDVKQCLPPPKDWTEREERRRTFWLSFCIDRYASIGTGWPMTIDERDIMTNLPASEDAFERSKPMPTGTLDQVLNRTGISNLQPLGNIVLTAAMFGRNLLHLHRPGLDDNDDDINGGFWNRHRQIERILLQTSLNLPDSLRLPAGLTDPNVVFANMCIHTSSICLHQAAIFKADKYRLPVSVSNESKIRCVTAAAEIASIMRMISHMDLSAMNPFISFSVYVAARVFVQYLKTRPKDQQMNSSLQFLLQAMQALRRKNPLTESFLVQLDLDLESAGLPGFQQKPYLPPTTGPTVFPVNSDPVGCTSIVDIRESQHPSAPMNTYGGGNIASSSAAATSSFPGNTSGPPFHVSNVNAVDLSGRSDGFLAPQLSAGGPVSQSRSAASQEFSPHNFSFDGNDIDMGGDPSVDLGSPATLSSRGGSTSQTSYSPGQQNEPRLPYRTSSPKFASGQLHGGPTAGASVFPNFSSTSEIFASQFNTSGVINEDPFQPDFLNNNWDFSGINAGTGMTSIDDPAAWDSMLENVTMGWDSMGPPHGHGQTSGGR